MVAGTSLHVDTIT